ncbi:MAG: nucleotide exchange factor GrpE [archaeon]|jgi:molecular chaperone GrpE
MDKKHSNINQKNDELKAKIAAQNEETRAKIHAQNEEKNGFKVEGKDKTGCNCEDKNKKIEELTIDLKRIQAEFENYQKRSEKQNMEFRQYASASIISDLLPVVDSLEQGIKHNKELVLVYEQLLSILNKSGLKKIEVNVGDEFDHENMECLMQEESELADGKVAQVLSTGYMLKDKILRLTKISISKKKENKKECKEKDEKMEEN